MGIDARRTVRGLCARSALLIATGAGRSSYQGGAPVVLRITAASPSRCRTGVQGNARGAEGGPCAARALLIARHTRSGRTKRGTPVVASVATAPACGHRTCIGGHAGGAGGAVRTGGALHVAAHAAVAVKSVASRTTAAGGGPGDSTRTPAHGGATTQHTTFEGTTARQARSACTAIGAGPATGSACSILVVDAVSRYTGTSSIGNHSRSAGNIAGCQKTGAWGVGRHVEVSQGHCPAVEKEVPHDSVHGVGRTVDKATDVAQVLIRALTVGRGQSDSHRCGTIYTHFHCTSCYQQ